MLIKTLNGNKALKAILLNDMSGAQWTRSGKIKQIEAHSIFIL